MANEITISGNIEVNNKIRHLRSMPAKRFDQAADGRICNTVTVPNDSDLALSVGGVGVVGLAYFENLAPIASPTHVISIGPDSTGLVPFIRLAPGQFAFVFLSVAPVARAAAGTPALYYEVYER